MKFVFIIQIYDPWTILGKVKKIYEASIFTLVAVRRQLNGGAESAPPPPSPWELGLIWVARNLMKGNKSFCIEKRKIKKLRISDAGKINLKKTDFLENAKSIFSLLNGSCLKNRAFLHVTFFQTLFAF